MPVTKIAIKATRAGFRRGGIAHTVEFTEYPIEHFTEVQLAQITAEPLLTFAFIDDGELQTGAGLSEQTTDSTPSDEGRSNGESDDAGAAAGTANAPVESDAAGSTTANVTIAQFPGGGNAKPQAKAEPKAKTKAKK